MKKCVYVISRCMKVSGEKSIFHFIGYYNGVKIKRIETSSGIKFKTGEEYLLLIDNIEIKDEILFGSIVKSKRVFI